MILLFSKVDAKRPYYKRDLLNACSAYAGARLQLAYQIDRWVSEPLRQGDRFTGRDALFVFCERLPGQSYTETRFHPIRFGKIERASSEHGYLTLELALNDFFDLRKYASQPNFLEDFRKWIVSSAYHPALDRKDARFACEYDETYGQSRCDEWQPLAEHMGTLEGLSDSAFLQCEISEKTGRGRKLEPRYLDGHAEYEVKAGTELQVTSLIHFGRQAMHKEPTLSFSNSIASITGPFVSQRSCGVQAMFSVRLKRTLEPEDGRMALRVPPGTPDVVVSSETSALVRVTTSSMLLWGIVAAVSLGTLMAAITQEQVTWLVQLLGVAWLKAHTAPAAVVIKIAGVLAIAWGARKGFSKLPIKG